MAVSRSGIFSILIAWTILGFFTRKDFTTQWGCIAWAEPVFAIDNIAYSLTSLTLLTLGFIITNRSGSLTILRIELLFWIFKLFVLKGGYAHGYGGTPMISVLGFDAIALTLRLLLIRKTKETKSNALYVLIPAFIIILLRAL